MEIRGVTKFSLKVNNGKIIFEADFINEKNNQFKLEMELCKLEEKINNDIIRLIKEIKESEGL